MSDNELIVDTICDVFIPPVGVALATHDGCETAINVGLTLLGWIPGFIHAIIVTYTPSRCSHAGSGSKPEAAPPVQQQQPLLTQSEGAGVPPPGGVVGGGGTGGTTYSSTQQPLVGV